MSRKKERPGEEFKNSQDRESHNRSYWFGEVFIDQAWAWVTELIEVEPADGGRCWQVLPLCLGQSIHGRMVEMNRLDIESLWLKPDFLVRLGRRVYLGN